MLSALQQCGERSLPYKPHPFMLIQAHSRGLLHRAALVALYKQNTLRLESERPIKVSFPLPTVAIAVLTIVSKKWLPFKCNVFALLLTHLLKRVQNVNVLIWDTSEYGSCIHDDNAHRISTKTLEQSFEFSLF